MCRRLVIALVIIAVGALAMHQLGAQEKPEYVGVKSCKICHKGEKKGLIYETWESSKHAGATDTLVTRGEESNELCLKCHSTGFGEGGYDPAAEDKEVFSGVQCEACHGPGSLYRKLSVMKDRDAAIAAGLIIPTEETCLNCHNNSYHEDLTFDFEQAWAKIEHKLPEEPAEEPQEEQ